MKRLDFLGAEYYATEDGKIFTNYRGKLKEFKQQTNSKGYRHGRFVSSEGDQRHHTVHRLIYRAFVGEIPDGLHIDHIDGDPSNNNVTNLRAITNAQNQIYKFENLRNKRIEATCGQCQQVYCKTFHAQKWCSSKCRSRDWSLKHKARTGKWH
jgi:HNH endonuclease